MSDQRMVLQAGEPGLTRVEDVRVGGERWRLIAVATVAGSADDAATGRRLLGRFLRMFARQRGGVTRRARSAAADAHSWLQQVVGRSPGQSPSGAVAALVLTPQMAVLAHAGPAQVTTTDRLHVLCLLPPHSHAALVMNGSTPALADAEAAAAEPFVGKTAATEPPAAPAPIAKRVALAPPLAKTVSPEVVPSALGGPTEPTVHFVAWPASPGTGVLLTGGPVGSIAAPRLEALLDSLPPEQVNAVRELSPSGGGTALVLATAMPRPVAPEVTRMAAVTRPSRQGRSEPARGPIRSAGRLGHTGQPADVLLLVAALVVLALVAFAASGRRRDVAGWRLARPTAAVDGGALGVAVATPETALATVEAAHRADDTARAIVRLAGIVPVAAFSGPPSDERHLAVADGQIYVLNSSRGFVERTVLGQPQVVLERGQSLGGLTVAGLEHLTTFACGEPERACVLVLDSRNRLWSYDGATVTVLATGSEPPWRDVRRLAGRERSVYVLDGGRGQIVRYRLAAGAAARIEGRGEDWLAAADDFSGAVDLAVRDVIYVVFADGRIRRYEAGQPTPFEISGLPDRFGRLRAAVAPPDAERLLLADRGYGRLVVLDANGVFQAQLLSPRQALTLDPVSAAGRFAELQDTWWDPAAAQLYVLAGQVVYQAPYP